MQTYVLHGVHLEEKIQDAGFVAAVSSSPEALITWLGLQFSTEREEQVEEGYDEDDMLPLELLDPQFAECGNDWWVFAPEDWPYMWEITKVEVLD